MVPGVGKLAILQSPLQGCLFFVDGSELFAREACVDEVTCDEAHHLRTWLEVQLRALGRARRAAATNVYFCEVKEVELLTREFVQCSRDWSLRQKAAEDALVVLQSLNVTDHQDFPGLRSRLLQLSYDWGCGAAERPLLAELVAERDFDAAQRVLESATISGSELALSKAELAMARAHLVDAAGHLNDYFSCLDGSTLAPEDLEQVAVVLEACAGHPELLSLYEHPLVNRNRSALREVAAAHDLQALVALTEPVWLFSARRHKVKLASAALVAVLLFVFRQQAVQALTVLMLPLGLLGFLMHVVKRKRNKRGSL